MKRRSFLAMVGLAPIAGVMAAGVDAPKSEAATRVAADSELKRDSSIIFEDGVLKITSANFEITNRRSAVA